MNKSDLFPLEHWSFFKSQLFTFGTNSFEWKLLYAIEMQKLNNLSTK